MGNEVAGKRHIQCGEIGPEWPVRQYLMTSPQFLHRAVAMRGLPTPVWWLVCRLSMPGADAGSFTRPVAPIMGLPATGAAAAWCWVLPPAALPTRSPVPTVSVPPPPMRDPAESSPVPMGSVLDLLNTRPPSLPLPLPLSMRKFPDLDLLSVEGLPSPPPVTALALTLAPALAPAATPAPATAAAPPARDPLSSSTSRKKKGSMSAKGVAGEREREGEH